MNKLKKEIYEQVREWESQRQWISRIHEKLCRNLQKEVPIKLIREILIEIRNARKWIMENNKIINDAQTTLKETKKMEKADWWLMNLSNSDRSKPPYEVTDDYYIFFKNGKRYPVLISTVRAIFECYSDYWKGMSGEAVRQQFKLTPLVRNLVKNYTQLYKNSHIDDPVTLSRLKPGEIDKYLDGKVPRVINDKYIEKYKSAVNRKKEADLRKFALSNSWYDLFMEKLERVVKLYQPLDWDKVKVPEIPNNKIKTVFITDAHLGKQGTDWIVIRFKKLTRDLVECEEKNIDITFWGDLWELFIPYGEMHPWQKIGTENISSEDLIMLVVDVFENMLMSLYKAWKKISFNGMWGNHDRYTEKKDFDPYRTPAMVVYRFLQKIVEDTNIKINILRDRANIVKSGKIKYIFIHGDWLTEVEVKKRALNEIEDGFYTVFVSGDKHHYRMNEISDRCLWIQSPALAGSGKYDEDLWLSSIPWAIFFEKNADWQLEFTVKRYL